MATNRKYQDGDILKLAATDPATPVSGDPVIVTDMPGVALENENADGTTVIQFNGVFNLSVRGHDGTANAAIAAGQIIYYNAGDTPKLNVRTAGKRYGYAVAAVSSGATATIPVKVGYGG